MSKQFVYDKRLNKLADFLDTVPPKLFSLAVITDADAAYEQVREKMIKAGTYDYDLSYAYILGEALAKMAKKEPNCGAVACAIGWCPAVFPKLCKWNSRGEVSPRDDKSYYSSFRTAEVMFGLNTTESAYLFNPANYDDEGGTTAKQVAERILEFVKNKPSIDYNEGTEMLEPIVK